MIQTSVMVKQFPRKLNRASCRRFLRDLKAELTESYRPQMIFTFGGVEQMTSEGVDLLLRCVTEIAQCDGELKLAEASPQTALVLELTQMSEVIESFDSVDEALASWDSIGNVQSGPVLEPVEVLAVPEAA